MQLVVLDGNTLADKKAVHAFLAQKLRFPEWYGANLDALFDCLTDLREETLFCIYHRQALEEHLGPWAAALWETLQDAAAENPRLKLME